MRAEQGTTEDSQAQNVARIANDVVQLHKPLQDKPLDMRVIEADRVSVIAPESVIAVTIGNLVSNAVRYTQEGEVRVTVGNGRVVVDDTGPGIPEDELQRVMDRHYRGEGATGKGSGLGLAIVKRLCDLYDWSIRFENRPEGGLRAELRFFGA